MTRLPLFTAALLYLAGSVAAQPPPSPRARAAAYTGEALAGEARISIQTAQAKALAARPGDVADRELEREKGGSGLRYSFDIKTAKGTYEVGIDAKTGKVLENAKEGGHPD